MDTYLSAHFAWGTARKVPHIVSLTAVAIVSVVALLAPLSVRVFRLAVPAIVLEILLGVILGPQVLGWLHMDAALQVMSTIGLSFLLLLAGLEIDVRLCEGRCCAALPGRSRCRSLLRWEWVSASGCWASLDHRC